MVMSWRVEIPKSTVRELDELPDRIWRDAMEAIAALKDDPFPPDAQELRGYPNFYKTRFYRGQYRLIYYVSEKQRRVVIVRARPRGTAYIGFE
ncbi:MAG: type II toxin-antitoxin system RelE family toxin [Bryobacteraceae bacterium]